MINKTVINLVKRKNKMIKMRTTMKYLAVVSSKMIRKRR